MKPIQSLMAVSALATVVSTANATVWDVSMTSNNYFAAIQGNLVLDFKGTWDDVTNQGSWHGNTHTADSPVTLDITYDQTFTMNKTTGAGRLNSLNQATCTESLTDACIGFGPTLQGNYFNNIGNTTDAYKSKQAFSPIDGGVYQWTFQFFANGLDCSGCNAQSYVPVPMQITLTAPSVPLPASAWLFGSSVIGLSATRRRRKKSA